MTTLRICFAALAVLLASTNAFIFKPTFSPSRLVLSSVVELDPIDLMCIEDVAEFCLGDGAGECDADDMIATENQLEDQTHILHKKIEDISTLLFQLRSEFGIEDKGEKMNPLSPRLSYKRQLSSIDLVCIENVAEFCVGRGRDECSLEDADALVNQLKDQRDILTVEAFNVDSLLKKLHARTSVFSKDSDDIDSLLGSISNILTMDVSISCHILSVICISREMSNHVLIFNIFLLHIVLALPQQEVPKVGPAVTTFDIP
uniref:Uncharacterized protein n=1 Tax=Ditylum brightwellii TaxID=49249 RepID=A0A7S4QC12_9STRA|mmetsp:Transcript_57507/g.85622  ORF Transcript_57507/g.85622 Transcript_57507/m.85622 type:complete len:260 (+) Transcript_57507:288-1067(+)